MNTRFVAAFDYSYSRCYKTVRVVSYIYHLMPSQSMRVTTIDVKPSFRTQINAIVMQQIYVTFDELTSLHCAEHQAGIYTP